MGYTVPSPPHALLYGLADDDHAQYFKSSSVEVTYTPRKQRIHAIRCDYCGTHSKEGSITCSQCGAVLHGD